MSTMIGKIEPGDIVGRCRIIRELGRGGVGTVYLATHQTLQIEVALKILSPTLSLDHPALAERFIREAQVAARIRHPNVIAVMDAAHDDPTGLYFIVLEYVGGGSLSWHLRHGPLPEPRALAITAGIAQALVVAEENGIVHRDIKPDNVLLDTRGVAKLADLGLAKHALDSRTSLTLGGSFMGTPAYMSPEQAQDAKAADTRDDIYSLGATLYETLTGQPPFQGETPYNIMSELLTKPSPKPSAHRPDLSRSLDAICRKMMAKTRALRYPDARTLVRDLEIIRVHGDAGFDRLEAASFASDSIMARQQALEQGVHTSAEGVAFFDDGDDSHPLRPAPVSLRSRARPAPLPTLPPGDRRRDLAPVRAAVLLLLMVIAATALLVVSGSARLQRWIAHAFSPAPAAAVAVAATTSNAAASEPPMTNVIAPPDNPPALVQQQPAPVPRAQPVAPAPVAVPVAPPDTNAITGPAPVALPVDSNAVAIPAMPIVPSMSAFAARAVAEAALPPGMINPTGQADLLKIVGKREEGVATPPSWVFYVYDPNATGNARIVTVRDGRVVKNGEDLVDAISPWHPADILPDDKLETDSTDALNQAAAQLPGVTVSSSEFELTRQKSSVPMWKVTLWARDPDGAEQELGDALILAENSFVFSSTLKADPIAKR
jgi:hypothetical protein